MIKAHLIAVQKSYQNPFVNVYWNAETKHWVDRYDATVYHNIDPSKTPLGTPLKWNLIYV
jgi:hypothetical protein